MFSTFEIFSIVMLSVALVLVIWWYLIENSYSQYLDTVNFVRGTNVMLTAAERDGGVTGKTVTFSCPVGKYPCIYQATEICTTQTSRNSEMADPDPISIQDDTWGQFAYIDNGGKAVDLTKQIMESIYVDGGCTTTLPAQSDSSPTYEWRPKINCTGNKQLILTYSCQPPASTCQTSSHCS